MGKLKIYKNKSVPREKQKCAGMNARNVPCACTLLIVHIVARAVLAAHSRFGFDWAALQLESYPYYTSYYCDNLFPEIGLWRSARIQANYFRSISR